MSSNPTLVDFLIKEASAQPEMQEVLERGAKALLSFIRELDALLVSVQDEPDTTTARLVRALVIRPTVENAVSLAYERFTQMPKEDQT